MPEQELFQLLFQAGFSTRGTVSDISGRGVGLDIVATNIRHIGGDVTVASVPGRGTTFELVLPTTLTLTRVLVVEAGGRVFAVPVAGTESIILLAEDAERIVLGRPMLSHGGEFIPLLEIERLLRLPPSPRKTRNGIVLQTGAERLCLSVPAIADELEVMTRPLPPQFEAASPFSGGAVLPDGAIALVIAVHRLSGLPGADGGTRAPERAARNRILVVDDSLIARELLKSILLAAGFEVQLARDGRDAFAMLQKYRADLVLSDIDMPVVDGVALTRLIKGDAALARLPVVIFSAREDQAQRDTCVLAGATAYITKGAFNQQNLLSTLRGVLGEAAA
jgi:two-component system chemotaxis sensor kinase CheA